MILRRVLKIFGLFVSAVLLLLVGVLVYALNTDFSSWRGRIVDYLSDEMERPVTIDEVRLQLGPLTDFHIAGLKVGEGGSSKESSDASHDLQRLELGVFSGRLRLLPLLIDQRLEVDSLRLEGLDIALESSTLNQKSSQSQPVQTNTKPESGDRHTDSPGGIGDFAFPVIQDMQLSNIRVSISPEAGGAKPVLVYLHEGTLSAPDPAAPMRLSLQGEADGHPVSVEGSLGALEAMMDPGQSWPIAIDGSLGPALLDIKGRIGDPLALKDIDVKARVEGQELADLARIGGYGGLPELGPYQLTGRIFGPDQEGLAMDDLDIRLGRDDGLVAELSGSVGRLQNLANLALGFSLKAADPALLATLQQKLPQSIPQLRGSAILDIPPVPEPFLMSGQLAGTSPLTLSGQTLDLRYGKPDAPMLRVSGQVGRLFPPRQIDLAPVIDLRSASQLTPTLRAYAPGLSLPAGVESMPPLSLKARVQGDFPGKIQIDDIDFRQGQSDVSGSLEADISAVNLAVGGPDITVKLASSLLDFSWAEAFAQKGPKETTQSTGQQNAVSNQEPADKTSKQTDTDNPFEFLQDQTLSLDWTIDRIAYDQIALDDARLSVTVEDGILTLDPALLNLGPGSLNMRATVDGNTESPAYTARLTIDNIDFSETSALLVAATDPGLAKEMPTSGEINGEFTLASSGLASPALLQNLQGNGSLRAQNIRIPALGELMPNLSFLGLKGTRDSYERIDCMATSLSADAGAISLQDGFAGAPWSLLRFSGQINPVQETLDMLLTPSIGPIEAPVRVKGPFSAPDIGIDARTSTQSLGKLLLGGRGGAEDVQAVQKALPADHPCQNYLARRQDEMSAQEQDKPRDTPVLKLLEGLLN